MDREEIKAEYWKKWIKEIKNIERSLLVLRTNMELHIAPIIKDKTNE